MHFADKELWKFNEMAISSMKLAFSAEKDAAFCIQMGGLLSVLNHHFCKGLLACLPVIFAC